MRITDSRYDRDRQRLAVGGAQQAPGGKLVRRDQGRLVLHYRPWLVFAQRTLELPEGNYEVGRGICHQVFSEEALVLPGQLILGAFGAGIGRTEVAAQT